MERSSDNQREGYVIQDKHRDRSNRDFTHVLGIAKGAKPATLDKMTVRARSHTSGCHRRFVSYTLVQRQDMQPVFVVRKLQQDLLGLPAIWALNLLTQVDAVGNSNPDQYPALLQGWAPFPRATRSSLNPALNHLSCSHQETLPCPDGRQFKMNWLECSH